MNGGVTRGTLVPVRLAEWAAGRPCEEDGIEFCHRCKPHDYGQTAFVSDGGSAFHKSRDCPLLLEGQAKVARRGDLAAEVELVAVQQALGDDRSPCQHCYPKRLRAAPPPPPPKPKGKPSPSRRRTAPKWIAEKWMNRWGQLTDGEQKRFVTHPDMDEIASYDRESIKDAIRHEQKLRDVAVYLRTHHGSRRR